MTTAAIQSQMFGERAIVRPPRSQQVKFDPATMHADLSTDQLQLFERRTPRKPYCTDDYTGGLLVRTRSGALRRAYVQLNPPYIRFWMIFDIDRPGGALAADDACLGEPTVSVMNRANGHAHLLYALAAPVLIEAKEVRSGPLRYLAAIENAYREGLQADPAYGGTIAKNALNRTWKTLWPSGIHLWSLDDLAEWVPNLDKHQLRRGANAEAYGLGRNCTLFEQLRQWSYRARRRYTEYKPWYDAVYERCGHYNADFPKPLDEAEWRHISQSVAKWVYYRFDMQQSDQRFSKLQSFRGSQKGQKQRDELLEKAVAMSEQGLSQVAISKALEVPRATVQRWLKRSQS